MSKQDKNEIQTDTLSDLLVADEQADETKGGVIVLRPYKPYQAPGDPSL